MGNIRYFEIGITDKGTAWGDYQICIKATRKPTRKEAAAFLGEDARRLGIKNLEITSIIGLTYEEAHSGDYDMDREDAFPVFGLDVAIA